MNAVVMTIRTAKTEGAFSALDHHRAQRIDEVGQGIDQGDDLERHRHDRDGIDRVAGEEERHRQHLSDAHHAVAGAQERGDDHREGGEERRAEHDHGEDAEQVERVPLHLYPQYQTGTRRAWNRHWVPHSRRHWLHLLH